MAVQAILRVNRFNQFLFFIYNHHINIQPWCSTQVDDDGRHATGTWANCGKNCPVDVNPWSLDDTLRVTHHNVAQKETKIALKLLGIMASSLLVTGLMVTGLGMSGSEN